MKSEKNRTDLPKIERLTKERMLVLEKLRQVDAAIRLLNGTDTQVLMLHHGKLNRPPSFLNLGLLP